MRVQKIALAAGMGAVLVLVAGCDGAQAPPTTVVVNTPPDGGPVVLLTVMVGAAFLAVIAAGAFAWAWAQEHRARRDAECARREAEDAVLALTGQPLARVRLELFQHAPAPEAASRAADYGPLGGRRAIGERPE